jgi:hypothetical protein
MLHYIFTIPVAVSSLLLSGCTAQPGPKQSVSELVERLDSKDDDIRREAAFKLSRLALDRDERPRVVAEKMRIARHLRNRDLYTCVFVAHTLAELGDDSNELLEVYTHASWESNSWCRVQACCGVRKNATLLKKAVPMLDRLLDDRDDTVVGEALQSLARLDSIDQLSILTKAAAIAASHRNVPAIQSDALEVLKRASPSKAALALDLVRNVPVHKDNVNDKEQAIQQLTDVINKSKNP